MSPYKHSTTKTLVYDNGRPVGQVLNGVYVRNLKTAHILREPPAIAFSLASLESAKSLGLRSFRVTNIETGAVYVISREDFEAHKFLVDRGFGRQYAVRLEAWTTTINQNSKVLKAGEVKVTKASKPRSYNAPGVAKIPARQMFLFKGERGGYD